MQWHTSLRETAGTFFIRCVWLDVTCGDTAFVYDTLRTEFHTLTFDPLWLCIKGQVLFRMAREEAQTQAYMAARHLQLRWKAMRKPWLYVSRFKFKESMEVELSDRDPYLVITYKLHPEWTEQEYKKLFRD